MKCVVYTNTKYSKLLSKVSVKNVEFDIKIDERKYRTQIDTFQDKNGVVHDYTVLNWNEMPTDKDFSMVIVPAKDYKIIRGLYGVSNGSRSQVFANTNNTRTKDTIKHELLHCIARKFNKEDKLHDYLNAGKTLNDFEDYLWARPNQEHLLELARTKVGEDVSPNDIAPDELGCAESVSTLLGTLIKFPVIVSTKVLYETLKNDTRFERTLKLEAGNIIISPTGYGTGHGHTGIIGEHEIIYSNDSDTGTWQPNYTITSWVNNYRKKKGFPIFVFKLV
jgi:hypothetical protein